jgi:tetratricopeptide (TPR) repeat protein
MKAQDAISRFRRDSALSLFLKGVLGVGAALVLMLHFVPLGTSISPSLLLMALGMIWLALWYRTIKGSRLAAESSTLIASGRLEQAEEQIEQSLRSFSMSRSVKSLGLLNLALVRLAQKRWPDTALLCRELLAGKKQPSEHVSKSGRLMLADSLLEMGDLRATHEALSGLYQHRLNLSEAMSLLRLQGDYLAAIGAWEELMRGIEGKVALAEIMPTQNSARVQATLALAANKTGRIEWSNWLRRRVELLVDVPELVAQRPILGEIWESSLPKAS